MMCAGYVPGSYQVRGEKQPRCPNEAAYRDVYCWEHRAEILSHHGGYGNTASTRFWHPNEKENETNG